LIYGDFATQELIIWGKVGIGKGPAFNLDVNGNINVTGSGVYNFNGEDGATGCFDNGTDKILIKGGIITEITPDAICS